jgi:AcrR family transcriptional regulator
MVRASLEILEREGPEGLTVQAIVSRAGSSVGSFYARFRGKEELLHYLGERVWRESALRWDEALASRDWTGLSLPELAQGAVRLLGEAGRSRAVYLRALERAPGGRDDAYQAFQAHVMEGIARLLLARSAEMDHPEPGVAVRLGLRAVAAILEERAGTGTGEAIPLERRMEEAANLLHGYLIRGERGDTLRPGQVEFFDIWG